MKFKTTITSRTLPEPIKAVVTAVDEHEARIKSLRRWTGNRRLCAFHPYNPIAGQEPSGQAGYGYAAAPRASGCSLAAATGLVRIYMEPC